MTRTTVIVDTDGCLTDGHVYVDAEGRESLRFTKRDGWLLREAAEAGITVVVCTLDPNPGPSRERAIKMGLEHIAVFTPESKRSIVEDRKAKGDRVVYVGDSPQDLPAMRAADRVCCPEDSHHEVTGYVTSCGDGLWLASKGGEGVLYEVLSWLLREAKA